MGQNIARPNSWSLLKPSPLFQILPPYKTNFIVLSEKLRKKLMTILCFLLDLRTISPPLLSDLKQVTDLQQDPTRSIYYYQFCLIFVRFCEFISAFCYQSLLQLANLYAASRGRDEKDRCRDEIPMLRDLIGLCYIRSGRSPSSPPEVSKWTNCYWICSILCTCFGSRVLSV